MITHFVFMSAKVTVYSLLLKTCNVNVLSNSYFQDVETPLDSYVNTPDPNYRYQLVETSPADGATVYGINMTSLMWFDGSFWDSSQSVISTGSMPFAPKLPKSPWVTT